MTPLQGVGLDAALLLRCCCALALRKSGQGRRDCGAVALSRRESNSAHVLYGVRAVQQQRNHPHALPGPDPPRRRAPQRTRTNSQTHFHYEMRIETVMTIYRDPLFAGDFFTPTANTYAEYCRQIAPLRDLWHVSSRACDAAAKDCAVVDTSPGGEARRTAHQATHLAAKRRQHHLYALYSAAFDAAHAALAQSMALKVGRYFSPYELWPAQMRRQRGRRERRTDEGLRWPNLPSKLLDHAVFMRDPAKRGHSAAVVSHIYEYLNRNEIVVLAAEIRCGVEFLPDSAYWPGRCTAFVLRYSATAEPLPLRSDWEYLLEPDDWIDGNPTADVGAC